MRRFWIQSLACVLGSWLAAVPFDFASGQAGGSGGASTSGSMGAGAARGSANGGQIGAGQAGQTGTSGLGTARGFGAAAQTGPSAARAAQTGANRSAMPNRNRATGQTDVGNDVRREPTRSARAQSQIEANQDRFEDRFGRSNPGLDRAARNSAGNMRDQQDRFDRGMTSDFDRRAGTRSNDSVNDRSDFRVTVPFDRRFDDRNDEPIDERRIDPRVTNFRSDRGTSTGLDRADDRIDANRARQQARTGRTNRGFETAQNRIENNRERNDRRFDDRFDNRTEVGSDIMFDDAGNLIGNGFSQSSDMRRQFDTNRAFEESLPTGSRDRSQNRFDRSNMDFDDSDRTVIRSDQQRDDRPFESSLEARDRNLSSSRLNTNNRFDMNRERFNDRTVGRGFDSGSPQTESIVDRDRRESLDRRRRTGFRGTTSDTELRDANGRLIGTPLPGANTRFENEFDRSTRELNRFNDRFDDNNATFRDR